MAFSPTARATRVGWDLVLFDVDDDDGGFDFSDHGETGTDDAPFDADAWDDVLNAFDAYREDASAFDVDAFGCAAWPDLDGEAKDDDDFDGYDASRRNAAKAVREHVASALRDALSACESVLSWASDEGEWETKRREAEDGKGDQVRAIARVRTIACAGSVDRHRDDESFEDVARHVRRRASNVRRARRRARAPRGGDARLEELMLESARSEVDVEEEVQYHTHECA